ncbi:MAG: hypothetical protein JW751_19485 [Polyangiaceae bacterium]|nr:hypothetical protein [Polyangiaceae bacterium]
MSDGGGAKVARGVSLARAAGIAAASYVWHRPEVLLRLARGVAGARIGVPLDAVRWLVCASLPNAGAREVSLMAVPPGVRVGATIDLLGNEVRATGVLYLEEVEADAEVLRLTIRLADLSLELLRATPDSPVATLLQSGALDLSKPGNLAAFMPRRPPYLVEARDDRIVLDLLRHPALAGSGGRRILTAVAVWLGVAGIESDWEHLDLVLRPFPEGLSGVVRRVVHRPRVTQP